MFGTITMFIGFFLGWVLGKLKTLVDHRNVSFFGSEVYYSLQFQTLRKGYKRCRDFNLDGKSICI